MVWNVVLPFAAALVGTKLQNKRDKKAYNAAQAQNEQRRSDYYVNLRNDAEKGGFNPLTALRSGGGMGYSSLAGRITQPLMTRIPLAAGIGAAASFYLGELTRQKQYKHETRMDELRKSLMRAQIKSMNAELSRDARLPPDSEKHAHVLDENDEYVKGPDGYAIRRDPLTSKPMQSDYRTIGADGKVKTVRSFNTEVLDTSLNEAKGGMTVIYGGGAAGQILTRNVKGGMPPMDLSGFEIPFANRVEKSGNRTRLHIENFAN